MVKSPKLSMTILFWILKYKKMLLKWQIMLLPLILLMYFGMETKKYKASSILKSKIYLIVYFYLKYYFVLSCSCILFSAICFFYSLHFFIWSIYLSFIFFGRRWMAWHQWWRHESTGDSWRSPRQSRQWET